MNIALPTRSAFRVQYGQDGPTVPGLEGIASMDVIEETGPVRDWLEELNLPKDWDVLDLFATPDGWSARRLSFVIADASVTRFTTHYRLQPRRIAFSTDGIPLTLGHLGLIIGECRNVRLVQAGEISDAEGECLVGEAQLYHSILAEKAWQGIRQGIFTHVCGVLVRPQTAPEGTGGIAEVCVIDQPGCPGARILKAWEGA